MKLFLVIATAAILLCGCATENPQMARQDQIQLMEEFNNRDLPYELQR